ncbi:hypothetical protein Droror1_Dr00001959 [Drosera rotundifolia]
MVARSPPKHKKLLMTAPLSPTVIRETVKKVDQCMARLQEIQYTVTGRGGESGSGSNRGHLRSSVRCRQDSLRMTGSAAKKSPVGKFPQSATVEWRQMSLPAMLVQETLGEILLASKSTREALESISKPYKKPNAEDPKTPMSRPSRHMPNPEYTGLEARRKREKQQHVFRIIQADSNTPLLHPAKSRINFKVSSPPVVVGASGKENGFYSTNKVSPRNRPWVKKTVLFPNPLFQSSPTSQHQKFCRTRSPVITRKKNVQTPHKFLIKAPSSISPKFQVKIRSPSVKVSPPRSISVSQGRSPMKVLSTASKLRRSLSPSRLVSRLASPLKSRVSALKSEPQTAAGVLRQRPTMTMMQPMVGSSAQRTSRGRI